MYKYGILLALGALAGADAFVASPAALSTRSQVPALRAQHTRARLSGLTMAEVADKPALGERAQALSDGMKHPEPVAVDKDLREILPHRYPFLLVDKILEHVPGESAVGVKCITSNEPQFTGHFPDNPIMPGVLQIEAMAQLGGFIALQPPLAEKGQNFFFGGIDNVKWRKPLVPGDVLVMEMKVTNYKKRFGICKMQGKGYVDGKIAVEGDFTFALVKDKA
mmetsp:Transcript_32327/g.50382  ORF Transcript_32327/g.50382 Transcript_32327/m.50382 type:complete len:222 (-) Transcript_32327:62-727(-)